MSTQGIGFLVIIAQSGGRLEEFPRRVQMNHVPRVGEYIEVGRDLGIAQGKHHFATVQSVIYQLHGEQLVPLVTAALGTDRENILAERGWLGIDAAQDFPSPSRDEDDDLDLVLD